jgi:hypothetical protein
MTLVPVPAVPAIPAGWHPVQADFNAWVNNSYPFFTQQPVFRATRTAAQSLTVTTYNLIQLDTVAEDPYSGWSSVATGSQPAYSWLCPDGYAGWYEATLTATTGSQGSGTGIITIPTLYLNGVLWEQAGADWAPASAVSGSCGSAQVPLNAGDYVQFYCWPSANVSTPTTAGQLPAMELAWVSS